MPEDDIQERRSIPNYLQATRSRVMFQPKPVLFYLEKFLL
jgi:hypothetical protein